VNYDRLLIVSGGEDAVVKMWSRNGILRRNLASVAGPVISCNWDNTAKDLVFAYGATVNVCPVSFKQAQT
jgi:hypothetical protein